MTGSNSTVVDIFNYAYFNFKLTVLRLLKWKSAYLKRENQVDQWWNHHVFKREPTRLLPIYPHTRREPRHEFKRTLATSNKSQIIIF